MFLYVLVIYFNFHKLLTCIYKKQKEITVGDTCLELKGGGFS